MSEINDLLEDVEDFLNCRSIGSNDAENRMVCIRAAMVIYNRQIVYAKEVGKKEK